MTKEDLIKYLRLSVDVLDPESEKVDKLYLKLSDEDILLYINIARTRAFADEDLDDFPEEFVYPLMLLAKKELYLSLAVKHARYVDIMADDNNQLKKSQMFDHYMKLVQNMDDDYQAYLDNGGAGSNTMYSASTYLSTRYYTSYNYEKEEIPSIKIKVDSVTTDRIEISWRYTASRFLNFSVFVSEQSIVDYYKIDGNQISDFSREVATITDPHLCRCRIRNCTPETDYYVVVTVTDWAGVTVYEEKKVTTLSSEDDTGGEPVADATL